MSETQVKDLVDELREINVFLNWIDFEISRGGAAGLSHTVKVQPVYDLASYDPTDLDYPLRYRNCDLNVKLPLELYHKFLTELQSTKTKRREEILQQVPLLLSRRD